MPRLKPGPGAIPKLRKKKGFSLDVHPQQRQIMEWFAAGRSSLWISRQINPPMTQDTVSRYRKLRCNPVTAEVIAKHLTDSGLVAACQNGASTAYLTEVSKDIAAMAAASDPYLTRLRAMEADRDRLIGAAVQGQGCRDGFSDYRAAASFDRTNLDSLRLNAELAGRLSGAAHGTQVVLVTAGPGPVQVNIGVPAPGRQADVPDTPAGEQTINLDITE